MDLQILPPSQKILVGEVNMVVHAVSLSDLGRHPVLGGPRAIPAQRPQSWELFQWRTSTVKTFGGSSSSPWPTSPYCLVYSLTLNTRCCYCPHYIM